MRFSTSDTPSSDRPNVWHAQRRPSIRKCGGQLTFRKQLKVKRVQGSAWSSVYTPRWYVRIPGYKVNYCSFCGIGIRSKISRHLLNVHKHESEVCDIIMLPKRSKKRIELLYVLANEGNFKHNVEALQTGDGQVVVATRKSQFEHRQDLDFTPWVLQEVWIWKKHVQTCKYLSSMPRSFKGESTE